MVRRWILVCLAAVGAVAGQQDSDRLYWAIRANDLNELKALLGHEEVSANTADSRGITPLMYAAQVGSVEAMSILVARGAYVDAQNAFGSTALMWSTTDSKKVRLLLDKGADVNKVSKTGRTALIIAAQMNPSAEIVRMLLAKGADPKA